MDIDKLIKLGDTYEDYYTKKGLRNNFDNI